MKNYTLKTFLIAMTLVGFTACNEKKQKVEEKEPMVTYDEPESKLPIEGLKLPNGFKIEVFADSIDGARSMAMGDDGTL
ncbi:MAG: sorbosone dehydrogenase family protein, partial [Zobellia laminariae]